MQLKYDFGTKLTWYAFMQLFSTNRINLPLLHATWNFMTCNVMRYLGNNSSHFSVVVMKGRPRNDIGVIIIASLVQTSSKRPSSQLSLEFSEKHVGTSETYCWYYHNNIFVQCFAMISTFYASFLCSVFLP